jgi:ABC-type transport system involved in multi-copper enzyme maturation permease subunit
MGFGNVAAVFLFEWQRALTAPRMAWWGVMALFPVFIITLIRFVPHWERLPPELWTGTLFGLVPMLISMLGTFLWTTPAVSAELERKSWVYLAVRPYGSTAVLLGKYLAAVTWVVPAALVGLTISVVIAPLEETWRIWWSMARLVCLSCPAYAAIYLVLGVLFPKRSMVIAVAYTLIFELLASFVPALINTLTVQYRLRSLFVGWTYFRLGDSNELGAVALVSDAPMWFQVAVLLVYTFSLLLAAIVLIRWCEFSQVAESDV